MNTATISAHQVEAFKAFVAKKNNKAVKLGCPAIEVQYSAPYTVIKQTDDGNDVEYTYVDLSIDESQIKINGYTVMGRIDNEDGAIIVSGYTDMSKYRNVSMTRCDHCNTARNRNHLVLLADDAGNEKVVGSTCLKDYTGHMSALEYLSYYSWAMGLQQIVENKFSGTRPVNVYHIKNILAYAVKMVNAHGYYISRARAAEEYKDSIRDCVATLLLMSPDQRRKEDKITEAELKTAEELLEWYNTTTHEDTDFHYNVRTLLEKESVSLRMIGYIVGLLPMWFNSKERAAKVPSKHIGVVGQKKVKMTLTLRQAINMGQFTYGAATTYMYILKSGDDLVVYKSSAVAFKEGVEYTVEATIKDHTDYKGNCQTVITRAKILAEKEI